jgi:hypothetical protein
MKVRIRTTKAKSCFTSTSRTLRKVAPKKSSAPRQEHCTRYVSRGITHHFYFHPLSFHERTCTYGHSYIQGRCTPTMRLSASPITFASLGHQCHQRPLTKNLQAMREPTNLQQHHASNHSLALPMSRPLTGWQRLTLPPTRSDNWSLPAQARIVQFPIL